MAEIKAVRLKSGDWQALESMSELEVQHYMRNLMAELETGIAVLQALAAYGKRRWPESEWEGGDDQGDTTGAANGGTLRTYRARRKTRL